MMWVIATLATSHAADLCADDTIAAVEDAVEQVDDAYRRVDLDTFERAARSFEAAVSCLDEVPPPTTMARIHQSMALSKFVDAQVRGTRRSMISARLVDPGWRLDEEQFPEGHTFRQHFDAATDPGPVMPIGDASPEEWIIDGFPRDEAPTERAFLLQVRKGDDIVLSRYLWDFSEIPDRGQNKRRDPLETPYTWSVEVSGVGRMVNATQNVTNNVVWTNQKASGVGAGVQGMVRLAPSALWGAELSASAFGPDDPLVGGALAPEIKAVGTVGSGLLAGDGRVFFSGRLGGATEVHRAWPNGAVDVQTSSWRVFAAVGGVQAGYRTKKSQIELVGDYLLAGGLQPYELHTRLAGALAVSDATAIQSSLQLRQGGLPYEDETGKATIGRRSDLDIRLGVGLALWQ